MKKYGIKTGLMALVFSPMAVGIGIIAVSTGFPLFMIAALVPLPLMWVQYTAKTELPEKASELFLPIIIAYCYYKCIWIAIFGLSKYHFSSNLFNGVFFVLTAPYFLINISLVLMGRNFGIFPLVNNGIFIITVLVIIITCRKKEKTIVFDRKAFTYIAMLICLSAISGYQQSNRNQRIFSDSFRGDKVAHEVDLSRYRPFDAFNQLKRLDETATVTFYDNYPKLDGATAAYPVYSAMVQELYAGLDEYTVEQYVNCSTTQDAYERLVRGEIDVFFGAQPSEEQLELAKANGVAFQLTPIAKEAFVFFVNSENPVNTLSIEQIQDIYQKNTTNWNSVGGNNEKILPFQRPVNSGSQTIMLAMVMRNKPLPEPLWEEYSSLMGGMISDVAVYRNYSSAIGYSFRYYVIGMAPSDNIKLLGINGIDPSIENIRNGTYPFTIDVYAVTVGQISENTEKLLDWILSDQGQRFIETCGYVRI